ncbi:MAG TPA: hemerythrin domain-containing protein [Ignavibacteriaceae bacterium]|nr:hemerythrin domain-containing protein [Ignavibacteriaceae bacterium]
MQRHSSLSLLSNDHHHALMLAQVIKKGAPRYKKFPGTLEGKKEFAIKFYRENLIPHFHEEENLLYLFVKGKNSSIDALFAEILNEHKIIEGIINSLKDNSDIEESLDRLGNLLISHIRKEERELFPMIENEFNEEDLLSLESELKKRHAG